MPETSLPPPTLVTRPDALHRMVEKLLRQPLVAVDTESNSLFAYREQVCLVQFSIPEADYLVDPLAISDLSALDVLFYDPGIEKIFHAAEYDLICLKRDYRFEFNHLFDTMVAARTLGYEAIGLGALLETEFGIQLDKRFQRANWGQRPLPPQMLSYARFDTHYLIDLRQRLLDKLVEKGLLALAQEDFDRLRLVNGHQNGEPAPCCWRMHGANDLTPQQLAILAELVNYRERAGRSMDRPVFKVINDETLVDIAHSMPATLDQLRQIQGMSDHQLQRHGPRLLECVSRGLHDPPLYPPRPPRPNDRYLEKLEALRRWRKTAGLKMGVTSDVILPRDLMAVLAEQEPHSPEELAQAMKDVPWRLENFGEELLAVLNKTKKR